MEAFLSKRQYNASKEEEEALRSLSGDAPSSVARVVEDVKRPRQPQEPMRQASLPDRDVPEAATAPTNPCQSYP